MLETIIFLFIAFAIINLIVLASYGAKTDDKIWGHGPGLSSLSFTSIVQALLCAAIFNSSVFIPILGLAIIVPVVTAIIGALIYGTGLSQYVEKRKIKHNSSISKET